MYSTFDIQPTITESWSSGTRLLRAISAQAKQAPFQVASAIAGISYRLATPSECMENSPVTVSRTWLAKSVGNRSAIRATPLAADQRTTVSCAIDE